MPADSPSPPHGRVVPGAFVPHPLLRNPHLQTLATLLRPAPQVRFRVERLELPDGDFVDLGWCQPRQPAPSAPLAVLLHGLTGGFESKYARGLARELLSRGWRCVLLQFRGAGAEPNRLPRFYHHGETGDLRELLAELRRREPGTKLYAVGWSLGANVLLKYLGESGDATPLAGGAAACPPFSLRECAERLDRGFARVYQADLLRTLKRGFARKFAAMPVPPGVDAAAALSARSFVEFDDAATAPLHGFVDAQDYYRRASCGRFLRGVGRPVLVVHAADDPFMVPHIVPAAEQLSPHVTLELCAHGGHVGFVAAGAGLRPRYWLEMRLAAHLEQLHGTRE
ncbi:MAG TPA: hydrolase [Candidatus Binatia bacterium]|nr:hydrolase [Candidatus Binatia bacterium]